MGDNFPWFSVFSYIYDIYTQTYDEVHKKNQHTIVNSGKCKEIFQTLQYKELKVLI